MLVCYPTEIDLGIVVDAERNDCLKRTSNRQTSGGHGVKCQVKSISVLYTDERPISFSSFASVFVNGSLCIVRVSRRSRVFCSFLAVKYFVCIMKFVAKMLEK